jgi:hypothetical protein
MTFLTHSRIKMTVKDSSYPPWNWPWFGFAAGELGGGDEMAVGDLHGAFQSAA